MQRLAPELIGEKIKEERVKHGLLQKDLAEMMYMDVSVVNRMEKHGKSVEDLGKLILIANSLGIDVKILVNAGIIDI